MLNSVLRIGKCAKRIYLLKNRSQSAFYLFEITIYFSIPISQVKKLEEAHMPYSTVETTFLLKVVEGVPRKSGKRL